MHDYYLQYDSRYKAAYSQGLVSLNAHESDKEFINFLKSNFPISSIVLEVGCGEGFDAYKIASLGYQVIAVDCSSTAIKKALQINYHPNIKYVIHDITQPIPKKYGFVDLVVEFGAYHLLNDPDKKKKYLKSIYNVMKPAKSFYYFQNGLCLNDVKPNSLYEEELLRRKKINLNIRNKNTPNDILFEDPISNNKAWIPSIAGGEKLSLKNYVLELEDSGFKIIKTGRKLGGITYPWEAVIISKK